MDLVHSAEEHGVAPLINAAIARSPVQSDPEAATRLAMRHLEATAQVAAADAALDTLLDAAQEHAIEVCVFKGQAVGWQWYPERDLRPITDIDVFTDPRDPGQATRLVDLFLPSATAAAQLAEESGRPFDHGVDVDGFPIDVHSDPFKLPVSPVDMSTVWDRANSITTKSERPLRALALETSVIVALIHGLRDNFADLLHVYDLNLLFDADPDWGFIEQYASREGWTSLLRFAVGFSCDVLDRPPPIDTIIPPITAAVMNRIWPRRMLLQGNDSVSLSLRRQAMTGLFITGRRTEASKSLVRRLAPPRAVIESAGSGHRSAPYPVALYRWRKRQRDHVGSIRDS